MFDLGIEGQDQEGEQEQLNGVCYTVEENRNKQLSDHMHFKNENIAKTPGTLPFDCSWPINRPKNLF